MTNENLKSDKKVHFVIERSLLPSSSSEDEQEEEEGEYYSFEDKMVNIISNTIGNNVKNQRTAGLILMAAAGLFLTVGNTLVQFVYRKSKVMISSFEILFVRSLIQAFFTLLFMIYGKIHPFGTSKRNLFLLVAMAVAEVMAIIFVYLALERMPVGDATVIQFTAPVFTVFFSFIILRKGCSCFDTVCGLVSFVGVIFIAKPDLISSTSTVVHTHQHNTLKGNQTHKIIGSTMYSEHYLEGAAFALLAAMSLSMFFILNKINGLKLDVTLTIMYPSILGLLVSPIAMAIGKEKVIITEIRPEYWGVIVVVGFVSFIGLMFMGEALQLEDAGPAVLIRNCDVIYAFILQYLLMKVKPTLAVLIGTLVVLGCSSLIASNRAFNLQEKLFGDRFNFDCCDGKDAKKEKADEEDTHFMLKYAEDEEEELGAIKK